MSPKISVLIPVHNTELFLANCLKSVISQTLNEIEIICVEDASEDHSGLVLKRYAEKDSRIRIIWHNKNEGTHKARKDAVLVARGKYIMFLDSDDELFPNACEVAYNAIESNNTDAIQFGVQSIDSKGNYIATKSWFITEYTDRIDNNWLHLYDRKQIKSWETWNKIYKADLCKNAFKQMDDDYLIIAEDVYFFCVYGYLAKSISMIEDVLYKYRQGFGIWSGIQGKISLEKYKILLSQKKALDAIQRYYKTKPDAKKFEPIIQRRVKTHFLRLSLLWLHYGLQDTDKAEGLQLFAETWGNK
ncbi:MAG: glycosyltransferase family 2 protein [Acidaminococcaceae bacterium]|nr:glycosyltransferase family 2 protein [Acidaminococcaceae bacterium]